MNDTGFNYCLFIYFFILTFILCSIQYYLGASDNLWNGNEIPKSNLHFHDKLHWHSDMFYSLVTWRKQSKLETRREKDRSVLTALSIMLALSYFELFSIQTLSLFFICFVSKWLQLKIYSEGLSCEGSISLSVWCLFVLAGKCLVDMSRSTY